MIRVNLYLDKEKTQLFQSIENWTNKSPLALQKGAKVGYDFVNWIDDNGKAVTKLFPFNDENLTEVSLYATWTPSTNTKYKIWHLKSSSENNLLQNVPTSKSQYSVLFETKLLAEDEIVGITDNNVINGSKEYPGFSAERNEDDSVKALYYRLNPLYTNENSSVQKYIEENDDFYKGKIRPDGTSIVVYRYYRKNYTTTFVNSFNENDFTVEPSNNQQIISKEREITSFFGQKVELNIYQNGYILSFFPKDFIKPTEKGLYYYRTPASDTLVYVEKEATNFDYTINIHYRNSNNAEYSTFTITKTIPTNTAQYYRVSLTDPTIKEAIVKYIDENKETYNTSGEEFYKSLCNNYSQEHITYNEDYTTANIYFIAKKVRLTINFSGGVYKHNNTEKSQLIYSGFPGTKIFESISEKDLPNCSSVTKLTDAEYYKGCKFVSDTEGILVDPNQTTLVKDFIIHNDVNIDIKWIPRNLEIYYANIDYVSKNDGFCVRKKGNITIESGYVILDDFATLQKENKSPIIEDGYKFTEWLPYSLKSDTNIDSSSFEMLLGTTFENKAAIDIYEYRHFFNVENNFKLYLVAGSEEITLKVTIINENNNVDYYSIDHDTDKNEREVYGDIDAKRANIFKELLSKSSNKDLPTRIEILEDYVNHIAKFLGQTNQEVYKKDYNNAGQTSFNEGKIEHLLILDNGESERTYDDFILIGKDTYVDEMKDYIYIANTEVGTGNIESYRKVYNFGDFEKSPNGKFKKVDNDYIYVGSGGDYNGTYFDDITYYYYRSSVVSNKKYTNILNFLYDNRSELFKQQVIQSLPNGFILKGNSNTYAVNSKEN